MDKPSNVLPDSDLINPLEEVGNFAAAKHVNRIDPQLCINLISILDAYLSDEIEANKPYLIKDGMKIIL